MFTQDQIAAAVPHIRAAVCGLTECWSELRKAELALGPEVEIEVDQLAEHADFIDNLPGNSDDDVKAFLKDIFKENDNG